MFALDVLRCAVCGGRRELIAQITDPSVVRAILSSPGLPPEVPLQHPARGPPGLFAWVRDGGEAAPVREDDGDHVPAGDAW